MSRKQQIARQLSVSPSPPLPLSPSLPNGLMLAWLAALLAARWLVPTEAASEGLTLWLVQLVLLTAVGRAAWRWRVGDKPIRFDVIDGAMAILVVAQSVSALTVVFGVGNARAAINLAWEWIGSGVLIGMLRRELRGAGEHATRDIQTLCLGLSLAAGVLAGYGLWQHYVVFGEMAQDYKRLTAEHDQLVASKSDPRRQQALQAEMTRQGIPIDPMARRGLEQRLLASRDVFGLFALANTFAGLLAVMLLVVAGQVRFSSANRRWSDNAVAIALILVIGFCLVLTKSRTAWVGLVAGIGWWLLRAFLAKRQSVQEAESPRSSIAKWIAVGLVVVGIAIGLAVVSGGLDLAVLSEAPKSLRYRLEWWHGTLATIREHFWFGTGPGNFRDYYLAHKLPESSEEIADPHNFLFDVWANAGTFGLMGLLACVGLMVRQVFNRPVQMENNAGQIAGLPHEMAWTAPAAWGVGLAFPLAALGLELLGHGTDERLWWLGGIWWLLWLGVVAWSRPNPVHLIGGGTRWLPVAFEAANVALLVHLLGAGGIAMPAITQLLWLAWVLRAGWQDAVVADREPKLPSDSVREGVQAGRFSELASAAAAIGLCLACGITGTMPELSCRTSMQMGDAEWERRQVNAAQARYREAAEADRWAIEPLERMAEVSFQVGLHTRKDSDFDDAVRKQQAVIDRLPFASRPYRRLGQAWGQRFEQSREVAHATKAVDAFAAAVERYPHHAELLSEWATACEGAKQLDAAREAARRAIRQDEINRHAGHSDKYLPEDRRLQMARLAASSPPPDAN